MLYEQVLDLGNLLFRTIFRRHRSQITLPSGKPPLSKLAPAGLLPSLTVHWHHYLQSVYTKVDLSEPFENTRGRKNSEDIHKKARIWHEHHITIITLMPSGTHDMSVPRPELYDNKLFQSVWREKVGSSS